MEDQGYYYVKNWWKHQGYRSKRPSWIRLWTSLPDGDPEFSSLSEIDQYRLIKLWIYASELEGKLPGSSRKVGRRLGIYHSRHWANFISTLLSKGFISNKDIRGVRHAQSAPDTDTDTDTEKKPPIVPHRGTVKRDPDYSEGFLKFWQAYPRKSGKGSAWTVFERLRVNGHLKEIIQAIEAQKRTEQWKRDGGQFIPHPATWLRQRRWEDETADDSGFDLE